MRKIEKIIYHDTNNALTMPTWHCQGWRVAMLVFLILAQKYLFTMHLFFSSFCEHGSLTNAFFRFQQRWTYCFIFSSFGWVCTVHAFAFFRFPFPLWPLNSLPFGFPLHGFHFPLWLSIYHFSTTFLLTLVLSGTDVNLTMLNVDFVVVLSLNFSIFHTMLFYFFEFLFPIPSLVVMLLVQSSYWFCWWLIIVK